MRFDFEDRGTGPALLFLPGSYSTSAAWRGVQKNLAGAYRLISTSLPGYGGTQEIRADDVSNMDLHIDFVTEVVEHIGEPVHLIGHSFGGLTAFAAVLAHKVAPLSMITFEGNPLGSLINGRPFDWRDELLEMVDRFREAIAAGDPEAAAIIIDFYARPGTFAAMPERFQAFCRSVAHANLLDWQSAINFDPDASDYAKIGVPCTIVRGQYANKQLIDISNMLADAISGASLEVVEGAGHYLISTHPEACARIIDAHMAQHFSSVG